MTNITFPDFVCKSGEVATGWNLLINILAISLTIIGIFFLIFLVFPSLRTRAEY
jgi:hypothetical protein